VDDDFFSLKIGRNAGRWRRLDSLGCRCRRLAWRPGRVSAGLRLLGRFWSMIGALVLTQELHIYWA